ncbi:hypothetical protein FB443_11056 [Vibrio crassostreae]|uniref:hypothetical protein n=1 Tax=Vibrio TaxID=662 RepID=UPI00114E779E|nr:hypothetical protein [Vibrio crassostreae]TQL30719.1 hypothetical protein FB443_11056 [Vibrio crassostreae]
MALQKNQQKVIETKALLLEVIKYPTSFKDDANLATALKTQAKLAKYENNERHISLCSLNTFKANSESLLDRGFTEIDELRINAKDAIEGAIMGSKSLKDTKARLRHNIDVLKAERDTLKETNFLLSMLINELRGELKEIAHSTDTVQQRQEKFTHVNKVVEAKLSFTKVRSINASITIEEL